MTRDVTVTLFERLHAHRHLVSEAYHQGSVIRTDENRKAIEVLQQQRVFVPHSPDEYRLHSSLRRFLASAFSSHRILQSSGDIGAIFAHLEKLTDFYIAAFNEDDQAATDSYEDEISQTVFEINDSLQGFITNLQANIETRFAAVTSLAAKKLQNEFYLAATHTLVQVLESFHHLSDLLERIQAFPRIETLLRTQLFARIPVFRSTLQTIYETLRQFLFEFRKIEARAKRIQQMWLFLKKTPDYEPRAWDNTSDLPAWLERSPGLPIAAHPDVTHAACEDTLVEIAQSIKADQSPRKRREAGALTAEEVPAKVIVKVPPHVLALRQMLKDAKAAQAPVSVRQWRAEHATELELDDTLWLELALDMLAKRTSITNGLEIGYDEHCREGPFSTGNLLIKDLSLWKSA